MLSRTRNARLALMMASALLCAPGASASIIIDNLTILQTVMVPDGAINPTGTTATGVKLDTAFNTFIGPDREVFVERQSTTPSDDDVSVKTGFGSLKYNSAESTLGRARVIYDGVSGDGTIEDFNDDPSDFGLNLDLSNYYKLTIRATTDNKTLPFTVVLYKSATEYMVSTVQLYSPNPTPLEFSMLFAGFSATGASKETILSNVNAVSLAFNSDYSGEIGADATVSLLAFTQVPEPGTLAVVGAALLGIASVARRRLGN